MKLQPSRRKRLTSLSLFLALSAALPALAQTVLITPQEASLDQMKLPAATRGIGRGPTVKLLAPTTVTTTSPFDLKIRFDPHGGEEIDQRSVMVQYMRAAGIDLTSRFGFAISPNGINVSSAVVPPGEHTLQIKVKDRAGRATTSYITLVVK